MECEICGDRFNDIPMHWELQNQNRIIVCGDCYLTHVELLRRQSERLSHYASAVAIANSFRWNREALRERRRKSLNDRIMEAASNIEWLRIGNILYSSNAYIGKNTDGSTKGDKE